MLILSCLLEVPQEAIVSSYIAYISTLCKPGREFLFDVIGMKELNKC